MSTTTIARRRAAHHRLAVQDHHLQGHADGVGQAVQHHADEVADQQQVAELVEDLGHGRGVGGQADDRLAALARGDLGRGDPADLDGTLGRHGGFYFKTPASTRVDGEADGHRRPAPPTATSPRCSKGRPRGKTPLTASMQLAGHAGARTGQVTAPQPLEHCRRPESARRRSPRRPRPARRSAAAAASSRGPASARPAPRTASASAQGRRLGEHPLQLALENQVSH